MPCVADTELKVRLCNMATFQLCLSTNVQMWETVEIYMFICPSVRNPLSISCPPHPSSDVMRRFACPRHDAIRGRVPTQWWRWWIITQFSTFQAKPWSPGVTGVLPVGSLLCSVDKEDKTCC